MNHRHMLTEICAVFGVFAFVAVVLVALQAGQFYSLLASQYSFGEDECSFRPAPTSMICDGSGSNCHAVLAACQVYCHALKVPDGEECRNVTRQPGEVNCDDNAICVIFLIQQNETVCTPRYRNVTTFCASADDIKKFQEVLK